jgi:hypothetical protein
MARPRPLSLVGVATGWTAGVRFVVGARKFFLLHSVLTGSGVAQLPVLWLPEAVYLGVKLTHLQSVPILRMVELYLHSPVRLHVVLLN